MDGVLRQAILLFTNLGDSLTINAQRRCGARFQATNTNFNTTGFTITIIIIINVLKYIFNLPKLDQPNHLKNLPKES